jgi:hypothetical protein
MNSKMIGNQVVELSDSMLDDVAGGSAWGWIADKAKDVGHAAVDAAKFVGHEIKEGAKEVASGVKQVAVGVGVLYVAGKLGLPKSDKKPV